MPRKAASVLPLPVGELIGTDRPAEHLPHGGTLHVGRLTELSPEPFRQPRLESGQDFRVLFPGLVHFPSLPLGLQNTGRNCPANWKERCVRVG